MKNWLLLCLGVLLFTSCESKKPQAVSTQEGKDKAIPEATSEPLATEDKKPEIGKPVEIEKRAPVRLDAGLLAFVPTDVDMLLSVRGLDESASDFLDWVQKEDIAKKLSKAGKDLEMSLPKSDTDKDKDKDEDGELAEDDGLAETEDAAEHEKTEEATNEDKMMEEFLAGLSRESFFCLLDGVESKGEFVSKLWQEYRLLTAKTYPLMLMEVVRGNFEAMAGPGFSEKMTAGLEDELRQGMHQEALWKMPNMLLGARMSSVEVAKEMHAEFLKGVEELEGIEKVEFEREGIIFTGFKKSGTWTLKDLEDEVEPKLEKVKPKFGKTKKAEAGQEKAKAQEDAEELKGLKAGENAEIDAEAEEGIQAENAEEQEALADKTDPALEEATNNEDDLEIDKDLGDDEEAAVVPKVELFKGLKDEMLRERDYSYVVVAAEKDGVLIFFAGADEDGLRLGTKEKNFMGREDLAWWQEYADQRVLGMSYTSQAFLSSLRGLVEHAPVWAEVKKVYDKGKEGLVNQLLFDQLLNDLVALEEKIEDADITASQGIVFLDEGLRMESRGGVKVPGVDRARPWTMRGAEKMKPFFQAHWCADEATRKRELQKTDLIVSLMGGLVDEYLANEESEPGVVELQKVRDFFELTLKPELRELMTGWNEISGKGLAGENLVMLDLKGGMPRFPLVPKLYTEEGLIPRFIWAKPVLERKSLTAGWQRWQGMLERSTAAAAELSGAPLALPGIVSARKNDLWSHFVSFPGSTPDFMPCVSVSDEFFSVGSSKKYAEELTGVLAANESKNPQDGVLIELDMAQAVAFAKHWTALIARQAVIVQGEEAASDENSAEPLAEDADDEKLADEDESLEEDGLLADDDVENDGGEAMAAKINRFLESAPVLDRLGKWQMREWVENGTLRKSIHLEIEGVK